MVGRIRVVVRWLAVVCAGAIVAPAASFAALPLLSHHGRWLTDPQGRVVILHGLQIDKFNRFDNEFIDLSPTSARFIGAEGFNVARVSLSYSGVEPAMGHFDPTYVAQYTAFDRELAAAGVYDLLDMMQGMYGAQFDGWGFPGWMTFTDGVPNIPGPFPQSYLYDPAEERAWDNFWTNVPAADGIGLQDHYARGLRYLARALTSQPAFLGFDLMNEPWSGSQYPTCANPAGCPQFDKELQAFYRRIIPQLRVDDPRHLVFYEPHALFDQGAASSVGSVGDPNAVFTFHNYCLGDQPGLPQSDPGQDCGVNEQIVLDNAETQAARNNDSLLEDEWGNTPSVPLLQRMTADADQHGIGWSYWAYEDCCSSPGAIVIDGTKPPTAPGNLRLPLLQALARPYPKLIAGTPTSWAYNLTSGVFALRYSTRPVSGGTPVPGAQSQIELPALQYPTGYSVRVIGGRVVSAPDANQLWVANNPGAGTVGVTVTPAQHHPVQPGPFSWPTGTKTVPSADCAASARPRIRLRRSRGVRITKVVVYVDGLWTASSSGRSIRSLRLPAGLADGSLIRLVATTAGGRHTSISRELEHCRPR